MPWQFLPALRAASFADSSNASAPRENGTHDDLRHSPWPEQRRSQMPARPLAPALAALALAACSPDAARDPLGPSVQDPSASGNGAALAMKEVVELPFRGSFTTLTSGQIAPPTLTITGTAEGTATHLGRFTATSVDVVDMATATSTGTFNFTAANGDQLFTTTAGGEDEFTPPNVSHVTLVATIVGGTGQFAAATGTFTMQQTSIIDFAMGTSSGSGSFDGTISRGK